MADDVKKKSDEKIVEFFSQAQKILMQDKSSCIQLRRAAGKPMENASGASLAAFYRLPNVPQSSYVEEKYFAAVCFMCLWNPDEWQSGVPIVEGAKKKIAVEMQESFGKRLQMLMDLSWDSDGYFLAKLFRLVKFCKSKNVIVDVSSLLYDLLFWDHPDRFIQKKWIKQFYHMEKTIKEGADKNVD